MEKSELIWRMKALGLRGSELAREMGVSRSTVSRWRSGARPIPPVLERYLDLREENARLRALVGRLAG